MASYSTALRVTNDGIQQDRQAEALHHKVTDLCRGLPLALFEGSRRKEDFHKNLNEADELLDTIDRLKDASDGLKSPRCLYSMKLLNNLLLMSISYHCRVLFDNFSQFGAIHSNSNNKNRIRESEIEAGYLVIRDMTGTLLSASQQFDIVGKNWLTVADREEMLGLLLQSILRLNTIRTQVSDLVEDTDGSQIWPRRCWNELGCPLMKMALSVMKSNGPNTISYRLNSCTSTVYLSSAIKSLTRVSHEGVETRSSRENLVVQLKRRLSAMDWKEMEILSQESNAFRGSTLGKRGACNRTVSYLELDHSNLDINTILEHVFGLTLSTVDLFWCGGVEDGTEEIEQTLIEIESRNQLHDLISVLLRRISSSGEVDCEVNETHLPGIVQTSRGAVRVLLPILYILLTGSHMATIPRDDLLSICKALLATAHDSDIVNRTIEMSSRLLAKIAQTHPESNECDVHDFVDLIDSISHAVSIDPSPSFHLLNQVLSAFRQMSISICQDEYIWLQLTRKPHFLSAIVRACAWQSLHVPVIQVLWILSNNPRNQRSVARHPGVLAWMIRIARENPTEESSTFLTSGITMEAWKGRVMKLAQSL